MAAAGGGQQQQQQLSAWPGLEGEWVADTWLCSHVHFLVGVCCMLGSHGEQAGWRDCRAKQRVTAHRHNVLPVCLVCLAGLEQQVLQHMQAPQEPAAAKAEQ